MVETSEAVNSDKSRAFIRSTCRLYKVPELVLLNSCQLHAVHALQLILTRDSGFRSHLSD